MLTAYGLLASPLPLQPNENTITSLLQRAFSSFKFDHIFLFPFRLESLKNQMSRSLDSNQENFKTTRFSHVTLVLSRHQNERQFPLKQDNQQPYWKATCPMTHTDHHQSTQQNIWIASVQIQLCFPWTSHIAGVVSGPHEDRISRE